MGKAAKLLVHAKKLRGGSVGHAACPLQPANRTQTNEEWRGNRPDREAKGKAELII